jgi:hypothetical protein
MGMAALLEPHSVGGRFMNLATKTDAIEKSLVIIENYFGQDEDENDSEETVKCKGEFLSYLQQFATLSLDSIKTHRKHPPRSYWSIYAPHQYPVLSTLAIRLFYIPTSSAASERVWSTFAFVHSKRRNRLGNERVEKLVFIYINAALLDENDIRDYALLEISKEDGYEDWVTEPEEYEIENLHLADID